MGGGGQEGIQVIQRARGTRKLRWKRWRKQSVYPRPPTPTRGPCWVSLFAFQKFSQIPHQCNCCPAFWGLRRCEWVSMGFNIQQKSTRCNFVLEGVSSSTITKDLVWWRREAAWDHGSYSIYHQFFSHNLLGSLGFPPCVLMGELRQRDPTPLHTKRQRRWPVIVNVTSKPMWSLDAKFHKNKELWG